MTRRILPANSTPCLPTRARAPQLSAPRRGDATSTKARISPSADLASERNRRGPQDRTRGNRRDFPAIFDQFDAAAAAIPEAIDRAFKPAALGRPLREPVTDDTESTRSESGEDASTPTGPLIPSEWLLEPIDENAPGTPPPAQTGKATFGIETVTASEFLAPQVEPSAREPAIRSFRSRTRLSLELMPMEEAVAPQAYAEAATSRRILAGWQPSRSETEGRRRALACKRVFVLGRLDWRSRGGARLSRRAAAQGSRCCSFWSSTWARNSSN